MDEPSSQASDELTAILRHALPEAWRHAVEATLTPEGFVFRFRDADGHQHALDARPRDLVPTALLTGEALGYSYTIVDPAIDDAAVLDGYRAVLTALAARESDLLPWLDPTAPGDGPSSAAPVSAQAARSLPDEHPAPPELAAIARAALPEAWRHAVEVTLSPGGFILRFRDAAGHQHALDARKLPLVPAALVSGGALGYSYTLVDPALEEAAVLDGYRATLTALASREDELLPWLTLPPGDDTPQDHASAPPNDPLLQQAAPELVAIVQAALPEEWRRELAVVWTDSGLRVRLLDPQGARCALDIREVREGVPALVSGHALAFSYLSLDGEAEDVDRINSYRTLLGGLAAREGDILPWLRPSDAGPATDEDARRRTTQEFSDLLTNLLPSNWRADLSAVIIDDGFTLGFRDETGLRHQLEARHLKSGLPALVRGEQLGFSYRKIDPALDESVMVQRYRDVLQGFRAHEGQLVASVQGTA